MRIITANLNGIRSAHQKGFFTWLAEQDADVVCIQELKAQHQDISATFLNPLGYNGYFQYAEKKGYSGVGLYTRALPQAIQIGFTHIPEEGACKDEFNREGRYVEAVFHCANHDRPVSVISVYAPSGSSSEERQHAKFRFMKAFMPHLRALKEEREVILCGDINIAHQEIDLKNWRGNKKNSGFLPEERAWLSTLFEEEKYVDVFRQLDPRPEQYTWWSQRGQAYAKNVGWRIDYQIATPHMASRATQATIFKEIKFSDHAPLIIDYDAELRCAGIEPKQYLDINTPLRCDAA
jgi:exodeoxyribonuclease-3